MTRADELREATGRDVDGILAAHGKPVDFWVRSLLMAAWLAGYREGIERGATIIREVGTL